MKNEIEFQINQLLGMLPTSDDLFIGAMGFGFAVIFCSVPVGISLILR